MFSQNNLIVGANAVFSLALIFGLIGLVIFLMNRRRGNRLDRLLAQNAELLRGGASGAAGEDAVRDCVTRILTAMKVAFWLPSSDGFKDVVLPPTAPGQYSRELDFLVVCEFGIYVFEVKHWPGRIGRHDNNTLEISYESGSANQRPDPLKKTVSKARELCHDLPGNAPWRALVVFSHHNSTLAIEMPEEYVLLRDLHYFFRLERDRAATHALNPAEISATLLSRIDQRPDAKHWHLMALPPNNADIAEYQKNDREISVLKAGPSRRARWWFAACFLSAAGLTFANKYVASSVAAPAASVAAVAPAAEKPKPHAKHAKPATNKLGRLRAAYKNVTYSPSFR